MPSLRRNIITGQPVVFAPERAGRPNAFGTEAESGACPFCPGNEGLTPPEIARVGDPWRIRVFPNKYPAVAGHEVIVETPQHDATFAALPHAEEVVMTYVARYRAHASAACVSIFMNHGRRAGASIDHLHSQVMPLPFVPPRLERELGAFAAAKECPLCIEPARHAEERLVISQNGSFVRLAPRGSSQSWEQWIVPRRHAPAFDQMDAAERASLAGMLREAARSARAVSVSYNVLFMNFPPRPEAHFYVVVMPRLSALAGFELATGTFIDIIDPAAAARALR